MEATVHKVYTEVLHIEYLKNFTGYLACEDSNHLQEENYQNVKLTTNDELVNCPECLKFMGKISKEK